MPTYNDFGIILSTSDLNEADKILNVYTKQNGLVRAVAKGARKLTSRFLGKVDRKKLFEGLRDKKDRI